jgi:hypothetical protein
MSKVNRFTAIIFRFSTNTSDSFQEPVGFIQVVRMVPQEAQE